MSFRKPCHMPFRKLIPPFTLTALFVTPKFYISIVFSFSWELKWPQEKLKTMLMQNFGVINKEHYGMLWYFWSGQLHILVSRASWGPKHEDQEALGTQNFRPSGHF